MEFRAKLERATTYHKKPDGRTESVRQSNFEKRGVAVEPIGPMTLNKEKHLSKYHNIYGKNS